MALVFICFSFISLITERQTCLILEFGGRASLLVFLAPSPHGSVEQIEWGALRQVFAENLSVLFGQRTGDLTGLFLVILQNT